MNLSDRIRVILQENDLKQKELAFEIGVSESYISKLLSKPNIRLSQSVANSIEAKYGYSANWVLNGIEPKFKQFSKNKRLSRLQQKAIAKLEKMNDKQIQAVLIFIDSLEKLENSFNTVDEDETVVDEELEEDTETLEEKYIKKLSKTASNTKMSIVLNSSGEIKKTNDL